MHKNHDAMETKTEKLRKKIWCHKHIARFYIQVRSTVVYICIYYTCLSLNSTNTYCIFHILSQFARPSTDWEQRDTRARERARETNCVLNERKKQRNMHECLFSVRFHSWCKNKVHNSRTNNETDHSLCQTKRLWIKEKLYNNCTKISPLTLFRAKLYAHTDPFRKSERANEICGAALLCVTLSKTQTVSNKTINYFLWQIMIQILKESRRCINTL